MSLCLITMYIDINRDKWVYLNRDYKDYFNGFLPFTKFEHDIIVFMDEKHYDEFILLLKDNINNNNITVIKINYEFLNKNLHAFSLLENERNILIDPKFKENYVDKHRLLNPEYNYCEYNILTHSKIDLLAYCIENNLTEAKNIAWVDFGYFKSSQPHIVPLSYEINTDIFNLNKVIICVYDYINKEDSFLSRLNHRHPRRPAAGFFGARRDKILEFQKMYHNVLHLFQNKGIALLEEVIFAICCTLNAELFFQLKICKFDGDPWYWNMYNILTDMSIKYTSNL